MKTVNDSHENELEEIIINNPIVTNKIVAGKKRTSKTTSRDILKNELQQVIGLIDIHTSIYILKFIYYVVFSLILSCVFADTHMLVIVNALIVLLSFMFTAVTLKPQAGQIETFKCLMRICLRLKIYVYALVCIAFTTLILAATNKVNVTVVPLCGFKVLVYALLASSSVITLVEAFYNIPTQALPDEQNKRSDHS